jgi:hypothetical protein
MLRPSKSSQPWKLPMAPHTVKFHVAQIPARPPSLPTIFPTAAQ